MDEKMKELIAIGASVSGHCQPCLTYHLGKAREFGVGEDEIRAAIEVGYMVERGASMAMRGHVDSVVNQAQSPGGSCCSAANSECSG